MTVKDAAPHPNAGKAASTDDSGKYTITSLAPQDFTIGVVAQGYVSIERAIQATTGATVLQAEFVLAAVPGDAPPPPPPSPPAATHSISGRVIGVGGLAVSGATLTIRNAAPDPNAGRSATTDASGNYRLADLARGTVQLEASASGYVNSQRSVALTSDQANPTSDFSMTPTVSAYVIAGAVVNQANSPVSGARIEITDSGAVANTGKSATTDATGKYRIEGLALSTVNTLLVSAINLASTSRNVSLTFGTELATANFTLEAGETSVTLKGVVTSTTGQNIAGATVSTSSIGVPQNVNRSTTTDSKGSYTITGLQPSTVLPVTFQANGYAPSMLTTTLGAAGGTVTLNATLVQNAATASPVTITFNGVATSKAPYSGHNESGFHVEAAAVSWFGSSYGSPGPAVHFETASGTTQTGKLIVTGDGRPFVFNQVNLYSSLTQIPWDFRGFRNGAEVFHASAIRGNTFGSFVTVQNPNASGLVDRLEISITNPLISVTCPSPPCLNPVGVDNIVVSY